MSRRNHILIVDDIEMNRELLRKIFEPEYDVQVCANGQEALDFLGKHEVDLVLTDLSMPVKDGYELISEMKSNQQLAAIPIVVETGAQDKSERRALDLGADDFIVKPFDPYAIRKRVDNLISKYVLQLENLQQALGQAERLNQAKNEFLSRMSHELRSPINSVISLATLVKEEANHPDVVEETSEKIVSSARYLLSIINDVLDMSALENQKVVITRAPFDFHKQMENVASLFFGQCNEKNITFTMNVTEFTEEFLFGDPMRLKEVLVNLLSNAVKFTPEGGHVELRVSQVSRVSSMVKLRFEVIDDGSGIEADRQEAIFHPFTQEDREIAQNHGGSGLGLAIVQSVVSLMGGTITVESEKGIGSKFTVELPFTIAKEMPSVKNEKLKFVRALIIDDDMDTQRYGQKMMDKMGIECDAAYSGEEALRKMRVAYDQGNGYDICFVDWKMPGMSGVEITKTIRACFDDDTVIVVASAYDLSQIEVDAKFAGANVVVPKPMFQSTVFDLLMNISGGQYSGVEADPGISFEGKRVLIAEDNTLNAQVAMELLSIVNLKSDRAKDGKEALEIFSSSPTGTYDAILMDLMMPIMNGFESTKAIRACGHPQAKSVPIIALTANAFTEDLQEALRVGMNDLVAKPIDTERLYGVLERYVGTCETKGNGE